MLVCGFECLRMLLFIYLSTSSPIYLIYFLQLLIFFLSSLIYSILYAKTSTWNGEQFSIQKPVSISALHRPSRSDKQTRHHIYYSHSLSLSHVPVAISARSPPIVYLIIIHSHRHLRIKHNLRSVSLHSFICSFYRNII